MKFIKKNKFTVMVIAIFIIFVVVAFQITKLFFPDSRSPQYGDRLDNIENVKIDNSKLDNLKGTLEEADNIIKASSKIRGKIININITVSDDTAIDAAKKIDEKILLFFDKKELDFYDIQIIITKEDKKLNNFPIIGYRRVGNDGFVWTKDRGVVENEK